MTEENIRNAVITIGTASVEVAPLIPIPYERRVITFVNTSTTSGQVISLSLGQEAAAGSGIVLMAGGSWSELIDAGTRISRQAWNAISSASGGTLAVHERIGLERKKV